MGIAKCVFNSKDIHRVSQGIFLSIQRIKICDLFERRTIEDYFRSIENRYQLCTHYVPIVLNEICRRDTKMSVLGYTFLLVHVE